MGFLSNKGITLYTRSEASFSIYFFIGFKAEPKAFETDYRTEPS